MIDFVVKLRAQELHITPTEVKHPSKDTLRKIIEKLDLPIRSCRKSVAVDALRESKASEKYLVHFFDELEAVVQTNRISVHDIFVFLKKYIKILKINFFIIDGTVMKLVYS